MEEQKQAIEFRVETDKAMLREYLKIARENYERCRRGIFECMDAADSREEKLEYLILLGLIEKDYRKITLE